MTGRPTLSLRVVFLLACGDLYTQTGTHSHAHVHTYYTYWTRVLTCVGGHTRTHDCTNVPHTDTHLTHACPLVLKLPVASAPIVIKWPEQVAPSASPRRAEGWNVMVGRPCLASPECLALSWTHRTLQHFCTAVPWGVPHAHVGGKARTGEVPVLLHTLWRDSAAPSPCLPGH